LFRIQGCAQFTGKEARRTQLTNPNSYLQRFYSGKKIVITGGSSGIGKGLAHRFLSCGAVVSIVSEKPDALKSTLEEFSASGYSAHAFLCDLAAGQSIPDLVDRIISETGVPDILVNNAGFAVYRTFEQSPIEEIDRLVAVNLLASMRLTRLFLPLFIQRRSGSIVNMASIAGTMAITPNAVYCSAKHALVSWSECLSYELAGFNIHVNVICPGRVLTPFFDHETFRSRKTRGETKYTVPLSQVVDETLKAIYKNRAFKFIPPTLGLISYIKASFPFFFRPVYRALMYGRINSIYTQR
jgi:short-subunit dehydrogenase